MDVLCKIENINSATYRNLILRKFFQIMFYSDDFRRIDVYTALVVGGGSDSNISDIHNGFQIVIGFVCQGNKCSVRHFDFTEEFLEEEECIRGVWGKESKKVSTQEEVENCLSYIFEKEITDGSFVVNSDHTFVSTKPYLYIRDDKKATSKKYLTALAFSGKTTEDETNQKISISYPDNCTLHKGIELVNWIKSSITFFEPLDENSQFSYDVELAPNTNNYYTPDFTYYISPPPNYFVDNDTATVELISKTNNSSVGHLNKIQSVSRESTLYYKMWKTEHHIQSRQMSRIIPGVMIDSGLADKPTDYNQLIIKFALNNPSKQPLSSFVYGILLSAVLAFGIDYTRIAAIEKYFSITNLIKPDIIWILISVQTFAVMFLESIRLKDSKEIGWMKVLRKISVFGYTIWVLMIFVLFRTDVSLLQTNISLFILGNMLLIGILVINNFLFLLNAIFRKKTASSYPLKSIFKF